MDAAPGDAAIGADASDGVDAGDTADAGPADCSAVSEREGWELCHGTASRCEIVFTDSSGCAAVCAAVGLGCAAAYEDVDGACAPNTDLPALSCEGTGHISDYCVCGEPARCGDGACDPGETCGDCADDCGACPASDYRDLLDEAVGFARPTGGRDGPRVFVTTTAADGPGSLTEALAIAGPKWISFEAGLTGTITPSRPWSVPADTTIDGRGAEITLGAGLRVVGTDATNIVIHGLVFEVAEDDAVQIRNGATDVWVDHCSFLRWGDGGVDVTNGVDGVRTRVTVSWSRFIGGSKAMLISATSDPAAGYADENLYVTLHHNFYSGVQERTPRVRFAKVHSFNVVAEDWEGYAVGASTLAEVLVENSVFDAGSNTRACRTVCLGSDCDHHGGVGGALRASGNLLDEGARLAVCETSAPDTVFDEFSGGAPPYAYSLDAADAALRTRVRATAGWRAVPLP